MDKYYSYATLRTVPKNQLNSARYLAKIIKEIPSRFCTIISCKTRLVFSVKEHYYCVKIYGFSVHSIAFRTDYPTSTLAGDAVLVDVHRKEQMGVAGVLPLRSTTIDGGVQIVSGLFGRGHPQLTVRGLVAKQRVVSQVDTGGLLRVCWNETDHLVNR